MAFYRRMYALVFGGFGLLISVAILVIAMGVAALWIVERELIARAGESLALGATEVAAKLDSQVVERMGDLEVLAAAPQLRAADPAIVAAHLETVQRAYPVYTRLTLADRTGRVVASTDHASLGKNVRQSSWFQAAWHAPRAHAAQIAGGERDSQRLAAVAFSAPIKSADGTFQGVIMTEVDHEHWRKVVSETVDQFGVQAQHFGLVRYRVVDQDGVGLLAFEEGEERLDNLRTLGLPSAIRVAANRTGWIEEEHLIRHVPVITGYARMQGGRAGEVLQWGILVRADRREVLANIQGVLFKLALTGCAAFMPLVGVAVWANLRQRQEEEKSAQAQRALTESESRTRSILDNAMDAVIVMNTQGLIVGWNKQAERILGWPAQEVLGQHLGTRIVPPQHRDAHNRGLANYLATGKGQALNKRIEITALRKDGAEFPIELTITPVWTEQGALFSAFVRDMTDVRLRERQKQMEYALARALAGTTSLGDLKPAVLGAIGTSLEWAVGVWWGLDPATHRLSCRATWAADASMYRQFLDETRRIEGEAGLGLSERVWQSGQSAWVADLLADANDPRFSTARAAGLHGALAIPISMENTVVGVVEFFSATGQSSDQSLHDTLAWIGTQVGVVVERRRAEQARRDSDVQLRAVVDHAVDGIVSIDAEGLILSFNPAAEGIFGYEAAEVIGHNVSLLMPEPYASAHDGYMERYHRTGEATIIGVGREVVGRRKDGSIFPMELGVSEIVLGTQRCFTGIVRDITARKQMLEQLNERETYFRLLSEQLPIGAFEITPHGRCVYHNKMWGTILSTDPDDILGFGAPQVPEDDWLVWFHPDDRQPVQEAWEKALALSIPIQHECRVAGEQGEARWVQVQVWPMASDAGVRYLGTLEDITARKQMLEQLNERETYFRLLSEQLPIGVFEITPHGRCVYHNKMWGTILSTDPDDILGFGAPQVPEDDWLVWFHPDDRQPVQEAWEKALASSIPIQHECRVAGEQGEARWVQVQVWPMASDAGVRYLGTLEDITARKRTIAHTMQLLREGRFELRTLTEAMNLAELLAYAFPDPARMQLGLMELLVNGVEHGNLELSYAEKTALMETGKLDEEMARRLALSDYASKRVRATIQRTDTELQVTIADDGKGFDWNAYLDLDGRRSEDSHGRGIAMSKAISFDKLEYQGCGNQVVVSVSLNGLAASPGLEEEKKDAA